MVQWCQSFISWVSKISEEISVIDVRSSTYDVVEKGYSKTYIMILPLIFHVRFHGLGEIFMSKCPFFYERIFQHEMWKTVQFRDFSSE